MSVMISNDRQELLVNCRCGCEDTIHIRICKEEMNPNHYAFLTYLSGKWYQDQEQSILCVWRKKWRKIWSIIRNKDYYYSDILMDTDDIQRFKEYVNQVGE